MNITGIISISGLGGLHKIIARSKNGLIVESLIDGKRAPVQSTDKVSSLEDISIYTTGDDMPLKDVLTKIADAEKFGPTKVDAKEDNNKLKVYFKTVMPEFDEDRVYVSDIKKVLNWYNLLQKADLLKVEEAKEDDTTEAGAEKKAKAAASDAKAKKATIKQDAPKKSTVKASTKSAGGPKVTTRKSGSA